MLHGLVHVVIYYYPWFSSGSESYIWRDFIFISEVIETDRPAVVVAVEYLHDFNLILIKGLWEHILWLLLCDAIIIGVTKIGICKLLGEFRVQVEFIKKLESLIGAFEFLFQVTQLPQVLFHKGSLLFPLLIDESVLYFECPHVWSLKENFDVYLSQPSGEWFQLRKYICKIWRLHEILLHHE